MADYLLTQSFPPLRLSAARRLLEQMTVDLDLTGYHASGDLRAKIRLSSQTAGAPLHFVVDSSGLLASCPVCRTHEDLPCTHAIAVLLVFREKMEGQRLPSLLPTRKVPATPIKDGNRDARHQWEFPCATLLLAGNRRAPYFVALTRQLTPMAHPDYRRMEEARRNGNLPLQSPADLFLRAFEPFALQTSDGRSVPGYRPKSAGTETLFRFLSLPGIRILSARTKQPYQIDCPDRLPEIHLTGHWADSPGGDVLFGGEIVLNGTGRAVKEMLWINFEAVTILCGNGSLLFFSPTHPVPPAIRRIMEHAGEGRLCSRSDWPAILEPILKGNPGSTALFSFIPPDIAPRFGDRSRWTAALRLEGRPDGGLLLTPEISHPEATAIPLFGPERHRLGEYISGGDSPNGAPVLIGRDREKELFARNLFEKVACLSSLSASIPVDRSQVGEILDRVLPELESQGFLINKSALHDGSILPGPVKITLDVSEGSMEEVHLEGSIQTGAGQFPLPGRTPEESSALLTLSSGASVFLEGYSREQVREICQLFSLDEEGRGKASRYYVSMIRLLRPDLPIFPSPGLLLQPFMPAPLPEESFKKLGDLFTATLRPYQKEAISYLASLYRDGLSGILADEMGLGKTISVLGFLSYLKMEGETSTDVRPPIVVLPASLLYNWAHEAMRFCPGIRLHLHAGSTRQNRLKDMEDADLLLTTYGTLRNDLHLSSGPPFTCLILDEAHTVKNPDSRTHQALLSIPARQKIAVTGTPVENRISDLWGVMNLLMPGLLGSRLQFERRFIRSQESLDVQNQRLDLLRKLVAPLVLRRTKEMVLSDLPPKVEVDVWIDPTHEERDQYHRLRTRGREDLRSMNGSLHLAYLTLLLRLRQFACHPSLLPPELSVKVDRSSKFDLVCDKIAEGVSEGHKILLFSQFTKVLDLFEEALPTMGISFVRLDGSTTLEERSRRVEAFQSDAPDAPMVFLASLKAGGVGLTLTRADYVFHYDPWWNPQVESQASDRSHRIGQTKTVFIYRFLMRDTVEERVQDLKASKKELFDRLVNGGTDQTGEEALLGRLSIEEMRDLVDA